MSKAIRVREDSAGHILAEQLGFKGLDRYLAGPEPQIRKQRRPKGQRRVLPLTFLRLLSHHPTAAEGCPPPAQAASLGAVVNDPREVDRIAHATALIGVSFGVAAILACLGLAVLLTRAVGALFDVLSVVSP